MDYKGFNLQYKKIAAQLVTSIRFLMHSREEISVKLATLQSLLPTDIINGSPFILYHYGTHIPKGVRDVEVGYPISTPVKMHGDMIVRSLLPREVLTILSVDHFSSDYRQKIYQAISAYFQEHGLSMDSAEMQFEILHDNDVSGTQVEVQVKIHDWGKKLNTGLVSVFPESKITEVMGNYQDFSILSSHDERVQWVKETLDKLDSIADEKKRYEIISHCAHHFAQERLDELRAVFVQTYSITHDYYGAIDAVIQFMCQDPDWYEGPLRDGDMIYTKKIPVDPEHHSTAQTQREKIQTYCHCDLIRNYIDSGVISSSFCYCGSGWYRQQWEFILQRPVQIRLLKSLLKGDDYCQFAIQIPPNT